MWSSLPSSSPDAHSSPVLVLSNHLFVEIHFLLARKSENILWTDWDFWVMTECPSDYLWDLCSYSGDHLWSLDISPRLILTPSSHPGMNDEALVMTMTDLDFSFPSPVCCLVFVKSHLVTCHIQTNINSVMKHKYSWVMSDHWGSNATGMMRLFLFLLNEDVLYFQRFVKLPGLRTDSGSFISWSGQLYNSIAPASLWATSPQIFLYQSQTGASFPPPLSLMLRLIPILIPGKKTILHQCI